MSDNQQTRPFPEDAHAITLANSKASVLSRILGLEIHRGNIKPDTVYSPEDIHFATTVTAHCDQFGNCRLVVEG